MYHPIPEFLKVQLQTLSSWTNQLYDATFIYNIITENSNIPYTGFSKTWS